jgi:hypothetical protein
MAKESKNPVWSVENAHTFNPRTPNSPREGRLRFRQNEETAPTAGTGTAEKVPPAGWPIDADLAVNMICNFLDDYPNNSAKFLDETDPKKLRDAIVESEKFTKKVMDISYGVTFDKDIVLKILSQPNCVGIRMYLCERRPKNGPAHVSLVILGVDAEMYDLNYKNAPLEGLISKTYPDYSLLGEYGYPPDKNIPLADKLIDDRYYLLKKANGQKK